MKRSLFVKIWLLSACILILTMVVIGGVTRLTNSGLSMVHWEPVKGVIPPLNHADWVDEFSHYKQYPEFQKLNYQMSLSEFKSIFFWEYFHRLIGRFIGIYFLIPFTIFFYKKMLPQGITKNLLIMFILGGLQGFMGWYMVKSGLVDIPYVSHYRLAIHLFLAIFLVAYIFWTYLQYYAASPKSLLVMTRLEFQAIRILPVIIMVQIFWGAFTAGLHAGLGWNTFPLMDGQWIPSGLMEYSPKWLSFFEHHMTVQFMHRVLAVIILSITIWIVIKGWKKNLDTLHRRAFGVMGTLVIFQFTLGILTLLTRVNIPLAVLHQLFAVLLLLSSIYLVHFYPRRIETTS